jgi:hypothetical protein
MMKAVVVVVILLVILNGSEALQPPEGCHAELSKVQYPNSTS